MKYKAFVTYQVGGWMEIEAKDENEAFEIALDAPTSDLKDVEYLDGSWEVEIWDENGDDLILTG